MYPDHNYVLCLFKHRGRTYNNWILKHFKYSAFNKNDRHVLTFPGCGIKKRIDLLLFAVSLSTKAPVSAPSFNSGQQVRNRPPSWLDSADCELPEASAVPTFAVFSSGWQPHRELFIYISIYMQLAAHTCAPCKKKIL